MEKLDLDILGIRDMRWAKAVSLNEYIRDGVIQLNKETTTNINAMKRNRL